MAESEAEALAPGSTIGILGGGQLGRMLSLAAAELGFRCHVYCPDPTSPAFDVSAAHSVAAYDDQAALGRFAASAGVVTYEFENIDLAAVDFLAARVPVWPGRGALSVAQDRLAEKSFLAELGIAVAPYAPVAGLEDFAAAAAVTGFPAILKTRRLGYDGKGQRRVEAADDLPTAFEQLKGAPSILEGFVAFAREVSVIAVRGVDGAFAAYDVVENVHRNHILHTSTVPATVSDRTAAACCEIARRIADALGYVGVIGVEFFIVGEGGTETPLVNELAPRVHNSGHWTQDACAVSQFENHVRAVVGWPIGPTNRHHDAVMTNLIGAEADGWATLVAEPGARLHLYGKAEARPGRKMGHVTRLARPLAP